MTRPYFSRLEPNLMVVFLSLCAWGVLLVGWGICRVSRAVGRWFGQN